MLRAMRLVSFGDRGCEVAGLLLDDGIVPVAALDPSLPRTVKKLLAGAHLPRLAQCLKNCSFTPLPRGSVRLGPPIPDPGSIVCIGLNYRDHAAEQNIAWPERPLLFSKARNTLAGPTDPIVLPTDDGGPDYEVELALVIGRRCRNVNSAEALTMIAGYMIGNDVTCRHWQKSDGQWFRAKSCDSFYPCGPALVTADEIPDPTRLRLTTTIDGTRLQDGTVSNLIHGIPALIAFISRTMTLEIGDIISTGTPAGVGCYRKPPRFLQPGDVVECTISDEEAGTNAGVDLGQLSNPVIAAQI